MSLRDWNMKLKLLRPTRAKLRLSIKSRVTNTNGRFCFTTRLNGGAHGTSYYTILISVERFESQMNLRCYSITCRSTIWRRARCRSSSKLCVAFQTLARREMRSLQQPSATNAYTNTTDTGEKYIPMKDTPAREWSPTSMSEPSIPGTGSLAELLGGSLRHEP